MSKGGIRAGPVATSLNQPGCYIIYHQVIHSFQGAAIKNRDILAIINEVSETLALTSKSRQLLESTLDALSGIFHSDCCWVQLVNADNDRLPLVATLGFTPDMKRELNLLERNHRFSREIIGYGHKIVIPSLNRDGKYKIPVFKKSGFRSLLAVPIMTYRIHGILGIAYRTRTRFAEDFIQLFGVIANLIGMSLLKSNLNKQLIQKKPPEAAKETELQPEDATAEEDVAGKSDSPDKEEPRGGGFTGHARSMKRFQRSHQ